MRYLITFICYGAHIHGDEAGTVDKAHNTPGSPFLNLYPQRAKVERERMDQTRRAHVLAALKETCAHRGWNLLALR